MRPARERQRLAQVARMYYLQELSQQEIARELRTTRSNVSRILAAARDQGVVQIRVIEPLPRDRELEFALTERFGLREARVLAGGAEDDLLVDVGKLGGEWLVDILEPGQRIGLSWGATVQAVVDAVPTGPVEGVEIVQLVGGLSSLASKVSGHELARELSRRLNCRFRYLHAPALFESAAALKAMLRESSIAGALEQGRKADLALVGIGAVGIGSSAEVVAAIDLTPPELRSFENSGAVGDICARYYDGTGNEVDSPVHDRVLGIDLADLRRIPVAAGVAVGAAKGRSIAAALTGSLLDVVICDAAAARQALAVTPPPHDAGEGAALATTDER